MIPNGIVNPLHLFNIIFIGDQWSAVMTDRELRKLSRAELLEILVELSQENEILIREKEDLSKQLEERQLNIKNLGSIAEASLQLSGIFQSAQEAVDIYIDNVKRVHGVQIRSENIIADTKKRCAAMEAACRRRCDAYVAEAKRKADAQWLMMKARLDDYCNSHDLLNEQVVNLYLSDEE